MDTGFSFGYGIFGRDF